MKRIKNCLLAGLMLAGAITPAKAADTIVIPFNDASESTFARWWGAAAQTYEHDASVDVNNDAASGSQKITVQFDRETHGGDNQFAALRNFAGTVDARAYTNMTFDVRFDPTSPSLNGDYGYMEFGLGPTDWSQIPLGAVRVPTTEAGWYRVSVPLDATVPKMDSIARMWVKIWSGGTPGLTGTSILWIDNVTLNAKQTSEPVPPPTLQMTRATPGLRLFASQAGAQYGRQSIYTVGSSGYSWVNAGAPVTYSLTLANYPDRAHAGFQTHLFLVAGSGLQTWLNSPDWNQPNVIFLDIGNAGDGTGYASFRYKTNLPNGNSMIYGEGTLASVGSSSPNGTWSLTFHDNTAGTITSPSGASSNFTLPADAAALFADPIHVYVGVQPNQLGNIGESVSLTSFQITGTPTTINDTFSTASLDSGVWQMAAVDNAGIVSTPAGFPWWLNWTLPDDGFALEYITEDLIGGLWTPPSGLTTPVQIGRKRWVLIPEGLAPFEGTGNFYRMIQSPPAAAAPAN